MERFFHVVRHARMAFSGLVLAVALTGRVDAAMGAMFITPEELASLPTSGPAWEFLRSTASADPGTPNLALQDSWVQVKCLGVALAYLRNGTGATQYAKLPDKLKAVPGTEKNAAQPLNPYRQIACWIIVADLIGFDPNTVCNNGMTWKAWLQQLRSQEIPGNTYWGTIDKCSDRSGNNQGCFARAARLAIDLYLGDTGDVATVVSRYKRWLGDLSQPNTFTPTDDFNSSNAIDAFPGSQGVINRQVSGDNRSGMNCEDGSRTGNWPSGTPMRLGYQMSALDPVLTTAVMLWHAGYKDVFTWGNEAIRRNVQWLVANNALTLIKEKEFQHTTHIVNHIYGTSFPEETSTFYGRSIGYGDWLTANGSVWMKPATGVQPQSAAVSRSSSLTKRISIERGVASVVLRDAAGRETDFLGRQHLLTRMQSSSIQ